jgi:hypothetical protein
MTSFLLSADINEGGKFELTAPISVKGRGKKKEKRKIYQYYNIEFLRNQFEKLMEVNAVGKKKSLSKTKLKLPAKMKVMENIEQKYLASIVDQTKPN